MSDRSPRDVALAFAAAQMAADWDAMRALMTDEYVEDYPQTGERIVGADRAIAVRREFPGMSDGLAGDVNLQVGGEDRWALAPNFTAIRVTQDGDIVTTLIRAIYPDGPWYVIAFSRVEGGRVGHMTVYFAPMLPAPEWRKGLASPLPDSER
jgi:hypothetical protein